MLKDYRISKLINKKDQYKLITSYAMEGSRRIKTAYKETKPVNIIKDEKNLWFKRMNSKIRQKKDYCKS